MPQSLREFFSRVPFTFKAELIDDQTKNPPFGSNLTYAVEEYSRFHQTSGTTGRPMRWLDTPESWDWVVECWTRIYQVGGHRPPRPPLLSILVRSLSGILGRLRCGSPHGLPCDSGRRHAQHHAAQDTPRQPGHSDLHHSDLRLAPGGSGGGGEDRSDRRECENHHRGRRTRRQHSGNALPYRAALGRRQGGGSSRHDGDRSRQLRMSRSAGECCTLWKRRTFPR